MGADQEPSENAKCMDIESPEVNHNDHNGIAKWNLQAKLRYANPEERQKCLLVLLTVLLTIFFFIICILAVKVNSTSSDLHGRCYTPQCLQSASHIIANLDPNQDPCQDFQKFACGGFLARNPVNQTRTKVDLLDEARSKIRLRTKQIIDQISPEEENSPTSVRSHIAKFLQSCLDERSFAATPNTNVMSRIRDIGGWEALSETSYEGSSWKFDSTLTSLMKQYGVFPFFKVEVTMDTRGSRQPMIKLSPSGFGLGANRRNYDSITKPYLQNAYVKFINTVIDELKDRNKDIYTTNKGLEIFHFEDRLLQNLVESVPRNLSVDTVVRTLAELRTHAPTIIWRDVLQNLFPNSPINDNFRILIENEQYFSNLGRTLSTSRDDTKNNYMMWHFVKKYAPVMSKEIRLAEARFRAELAGGTLESIKHQDIFDGCLDLTIEYFGLGLAHLFEKNSGEESRRSAERLFSKIPRIARKHIRSVDWLSEAKFPATDRIENLNIDVGFPTIARSDFDVMSYYKEGQTNRHLLDNIIEQNTLRLKWMANAVDVRNREPTKTEIAKKLLAWTISPLDVTPKYTYGLNQVVVPLGFLYDPIYSSQQSEALQFAAVARVAQEALKAIDYYGLQFKDFGTTPNTTFEELSKKLTCIAEQTENELHERGVLNKFVEESVSDIAGLKVALEAFDEFGTIPKLPGLDYEPKQLFYIAYGQLMCEHSSDNRIVYMNGTLQTAPQRLRLHRMLQQTTDFADTFGCSSSAKMVPSKVCNIW